MKHKLFQATRVLPLFLAAAVTMSATAMAADRVVETDAAVPMISETDVPLTVATAEAGLALGIGTVETGSLNVRNNPNEDADIVAVATEGQQGVVLEQDGDWYWVSFDGITGFVSGEYLEITAEGTADLGYGLVTCSAANIRSGPDSESDTIACLTEDDVVSITGVTDGWYQVTFDSGSEGYIRSDLVDPTAEVPAEMIYDYAVIECSAANLRSEPDSSSEKADVLYEGSLCTLLQQEGDWYLVQYGDTTGYVLSSLMETTNSESDGSTGIETLNEAIAREAEEAAEAQAAAEAAAAAAAAQTSSSSSSSSQSSASQQTVTQETTSSQSSASQETTTQATTTSQETVAPSYNSSSSSSIVSVAEQYLGVPYVWGGTSPSGFDCSGFVQYVFRQCGYSISRVASAQYSNGTYVSYANLQPGDLVFFERTYSTSGISHVGIYIGGGQFIHAASSGVKISSLSESYYSSRYYGACRIA